MAATKSVLTTGVVYVRGGGSPTFTDVTITNVLTVVGVLGSAYLTAGAASYINWNGRTYMKSPADGQWNITNNAESAGAGFDVNTDAVLKVRTRAQSAYATVDALGYSVGGVAGASKGAGAVVSITVVNGIVTAIT